MCMCVYMRLLDKLSEWKVDLLGNVLEGLDDLFTISRVDF